MAGGRLRRRLPKAVAVQMLEQNRPELSVPDRREADPVRELAQCRVAADQVIDGKVPDPTGGATHYYATRIKAPAWAAKAKQTLKLGHHVFFKDVP